LLDAADCLLAETDDAFEILTDECCSSCTTESKEPLQSVLLAFALSCWVTAINFFRLTTKALLYAWMASFTFLL